MKKFRKIPLSVRLIPLLERAFIQAQGNPSLFDQRLVNPYV